MNASRVVPASRERALVLGGAGSAGNAWEIGVVVGLSQCGVVLTRADVVVGTSAGATVAAQITGTDPSDLLSAILTSTTPSPPPGGRPVSGHPHRGQVADHLDRTNRIIAAAQDAADMRRRMGASAVELDAMSDGTWSPRWRETVASRLPDERWPDHSVRITAVDALTGEPVVFDRGDGVDLVDAVAASTSSGAAYRIGEHRYIDGGYRRNENADLALGYARVLVLSPFGGRSRHPREWGMQLAAQVDELRAAGSNVETVFPDADSLGAMGDNVMDPATRQPAARAGFDQGRSLAARLTGFWN